MGLIYGDSITLARADEIMRRLKLVSASSNVVFGVGSFTYQYNTRDTWFCDESDLGKSVAKGE